MLQAPRSETPLAHRPEQARDRGALSIFTAIIAMTVVIFLGGVVDFEQKLEARHDANILAQEAARAGAGQVNLDRFYTRGQFTIDRAAAIRASTAYLQASGHTGTVTPAGTRSIRVSVVIERPAIFLPLIGISNLRVRGAATADLVAGVEGPTQEP
jgi:Flp pilus assembly protein TadG